MILPRVYSSRSRHRAPRTGDYLVPRPLSESDYRYASVRLAWERVRVLKLGGGSRAAPWADIWAAWIGILLVILVRFCKKTEDPALEMADVGKLVKIDVDYSDAVDKKLPECQEMAKVCRGHFIHQSSSLVPMPQAISRRFSAWPENKARQYSFGYPAGCATSMVREWISGQYFNSGHGTSWPSHSLRWQFFWVWMHTLPSNFPTLCSWAGAVSGNPLLSGNPLRYLSARSHA